MEDNKYAKTGWGRNEVMELYRDSVNEALVEMMDEVGA